MKNKGCYLLVLFLEKEKELQIGKLGKFTFKRGFYCYTGSALNSLKARIDRHMKKSKKHHWHIDYLRSHGEVIRVIVIESSEKIECRLNQLVAKIADDVPVRKFGSSDCTCFSHLHFFEQDPLSQLETLPSQFKNPPSSPP